MRYSSYAHLDLDINEIGVYTRREELLCLVGLGDCPKASLSCLAYFPLKNEFKIHSFTGSCVLRHRGA